MTKRSDDMNMHVKGNNSMHRTFYKARDKYRHQIRFCYIRNETKKGNMDLVLKYGPDTEFKPTGTCTCLY